MQPNNNRPVFLPLVTAQRAQEAAHAGEQFYQYQRINDLVTKKDGQLARRITTEPGAERSWEVLLDPEGYASAEQWQRAVTEGKTEPFEPTTVVRKESELSPVSGTLRAAVEDFDNPKL